MKLFALFVILGLALNAQAQEVDFNGTIYKVNGKAILKDGLDVTNALSIEEQTSILDVFNKQMALDEERENAVKKIKKAEKDQKKAEKRQKRAEKELKAKEKAQSRFEKSGKAYSAAISKYERLKKKGKLSPEDEAKWLKKIDNLKEDNEKAKRKL